MLSTKKRMLGIIGMLAIVASACTVNVERNPDGSLQIIGEVTAESLAGEFERDPNNENVTVSIDGGAMTVAFTETEENGEKADIVLKVDLGADDGLLVVDITEATYNGNEVPDWITDIYNQVIAEGIKASATEEPDASLVSLVADDGKITTEWRIETDESKGS